MEIVLLVLVLMAILLFWNAKILTSEAENPFTMAANIIMAVLCMFLCIFYLCPTEQKILEGRVQSTKPTKIQFISGLDLYVKGEFTKVTFISGDTIKVHGNHRNLVNKKCSFRYGKEGRALWKTARFIGCYEPKAEKIMCLQKKE